MAVGSGAWSFTRSRAWLFGTTFCCLGLLGIIILVQSSRLPKEDTWDDEQLMSEWQFDEIEVETDLSPDAEPELLLTPDGSDSISEIDPRISESPIQHAVAETEDQYFQRIEVVHQTTNTTSAPTVRGAKLLGIIEVAPERSLPAPSSTYPTQSANMANPVR